MKPFPDTLSMVSVACGIRNNGRAKKIVLTDEQKEWLIRWFPEVENSRLVEASGMSHSTLHKFARELGLTKSKKGMKAIKRRQAAHIKKLCERNGYYENMRGKQVSDACKEGTKRMWQEVRDGKREHFYKKMKRENPRRYKKIMQRMSDERKETIRKERRRDLYGLERHTKLRLPMQSYTKRQVSHRYNALRKGYYVMLDCSEGSGERYNIYYNEETKRSPLFERNLIKDGFKVVQGFD